MHIGRTQIRAPVLLFELFVEGVHPQCWAIPERLKLLVVLISCQLFLLDHTKFPLSIPLGIRGLHEPFPNPRYHPLVLPLLIASITLAFMSTFNQGQLDRMVGALPTSTS